MLIIHNQNYNPFFNIACEEYFFKQFSENIIFIYRNQPSIIIGKHQNAYKEVNYDFVQDNAIPVVRRISGGGAVYHDLGNLNFAFIQNKSDGNLSDFKGFTLPILQFLNEIEIPAKLESRNDLRVNGKKISGNSEHIFKNRVLHHGTLLYNTNLSNLRNSLRISDYYIDHSVKSVPSPVINLSDFLAEPISIEEFEDLLFIYLKKKFPEASDYILNDKDIENINLLIANKYSTWEWNYGYFGNYEFKQNAEIDGEHLEIYFQVKNGLIQEFKIECPYFNSDECALIDLSLKNTQHKYSAIREKLESLDLFHNDKRISIQNLMKLLF